MIYIVQGEEEYFIRDKINELSKAAKGDIVHFNGSDKTFNINQMLDACMSNTLFSDYATVFVEEPYFLIKKCEDKELKDLDDYISNPPYETDLIFYTYTNSFNSRLKTYKNITTNAQVFDYKTLDYTNFNNYVRQRINENKLNISNEAINQLNNICKRSVSLFESNLEILKLYPEYIDINVISKLCNKSADNEAFDLINAITAKNISEAIRIERKMLNENDSALSIIGLLANQLRYLYHIAYLNNLGKSKAEIMSLTKSSDYRLNKANESLRRLNMNQIMNLLYQLSDLDCLSKSDYSINDKSRFELFILRLAKRSENAGN